MNINQWDELWKKLIFKLNFCDNLTGWVFTSNVEPDFDGAEGERSSLVDGCLSREAGAGVAEERHRVEEGAAALLLSSVIRTRKKKSPVDFAQRYKVFAPEQHIQMQL